jgi:hypothetical protein
VAKHPVHQSSGRRVVDVLGGDDKACPGQLDLEQHVRVIAAIAGKAVDLPENHEIDIVLLFDSAAHGVQFRPVVRLRGLSTLDVLYLELCARLRAVLRRTNPQHARDRPLRIRSLAIDTASREVTINDRALDLRRLEYDLLLHLASEPRRVFHKRELLINLWGYPDPGTTRTLDTHASRLRRKLSGNGERWIINVRGVVAAPACSWCPIADADFLSAAMAALRRSRGDLYATFRTPPLRAWQEKRPSRQCQTAICS